jgi:beta-glucosidase
MTTLEGGPTTSADPDARAREVEAQLTDDERFSLLFSLMVVVFGGARDPRVPVDVPQIAGWVPGVERLGVPALKISDAALGVTNPGGGRPGDTATALPAGLCMAASFNPTMARQAGALIGREARSRGFNVLCGGSMNLVREPRNGRNFEYVSEDPWLSGVMAAENVIGTQSEGVISMVKHLSLNCNETNKFWLDVVIEEGAHREADLLAFEIAIERADPGSIMCAYNKVNGAYCAGNELLLRVVKDKLGFKGWIMSDWKAVYSWDFALKGLDQHSGAQLDDKEWFNEPLREAYAAGHVPKERVSDMARRILRTMFAVGVDQDRPAPEIDLDAHRQTTLEVARQGIVLLDNDGILPLREDTVSIAVIGGHADVGVMAGCGSSLVTPPGGYAFEAPVGGEGPLASLRKESFFPSSPLAELKKLLPKAAITYAPSAYPAEAAALARRCAVAVVFATKPESEGFDSPDLTLPFGQDAVIAAVADANPNTVVVLETGNAVTLPWRERVRAIVEAWYPGQAGGQAIAEVLTGAVNPSGRLPITWPADVSQLPNPELPGYGAAFGTPGTLDVHEGSDVGYRWFARHGHSPTYAFGHGLSYTTFAYSDLQVSGGETVSATVSVTNTGDLHGAEVVQLYLDKTPTGARRRLLGFERVELDPGESRTVTMIADPRVIASFDTHAGQWRIDEGGYTVAVGTSAADVEHTAKVELGGRTFGR